MKILSKATAYAMIYALAFLASGIPAFIIFTVLAQNGIVPEQMGFVDMWIIVGALGIVTSLFDVGNSDS